MSLDNTLNRYDPHKIAESKMEAIKKAMISVYEGALKTFASIPFPWNIVAVGGAIAAGMALVNKIKGFEHIK